MYAKINLEEVRHEVILRERMKKGLHLVHRGMGAQFISGNDGYDAEKNILTVQLAYSGGENAETMQQLWLRDVEDDTKVLQTLLIDELNEAFARMFELRGLCDCDLKLMNVEDQDTRKCIFIPRTGAS